MAIIKLKLFSCTEQDVKEFLANLTARELLTREPRKATGSVPNPADDELLTQEHRGITSSVSEPANGGASPTHFIDADPHVESPRSPQDPDINPPPKS